MGAHRRWLTGSRQDCPPERQNEAAMCLAIPGKILSLDADLATVEVSGVRREVNVALLPDLEVGDWILIHVGFALSRLNEEEARQTLSYLEQLGELELPQ